MTASLDDFIIAAHETVDDEANESHDESFKITDDGTASWAMRKLRKIRNQQASNFEIAERESERINEWLGSVNAPLIRDINYFEALLTEYALDCRVDPSDGRKTISLPAGKVSTRAKQPKWTVNNDEFIPWAEENFPDLIRIKKEPDLSAIKERFSGAPVAEADGVVVTEDGEIIPGVSIMEQEWSANISVEGEA
jgi:hypothetical protein